MRQGCGQLTICEATYSFYNGNFNPKSKVLVIIKKRLFRTLYKYKWVINQEGPTYSLPILVGINLLDYLVPVLGIRTSGN